MRETAKIPVALECFFAVKPVVDQVVISLRHVLHNTEQQPVTYYLSSSPLKSHADGRFILFSPLFSLPLSAGLGIPTKSVEHQMKFNLNVFNSGGPQTCFY